MMRRSTRAYRGSTIRPSNPLAKLTIDQLNTRLDEAISIEKAAASAYERARSLGSKREYNDSKEGWATANASVAEIRKELRRRNAGA